jgi:hypothetical protein
MSINERLRKILGNHDLAHLDFVWDYWVLVIENSDEEKSFRANTIEECLDKAENNE